MQRAEKAEPSGVHLWLVLMKAYHSVQAYSEKTRGGSGLGDSDFRVLEVLLHKGPLPVNTIGPKVWLTPGSISVAVDRLYERGLVSRVESEEDRRKKIVALTAKGRKLIEGVFAAHAAEMEKLAEVLTPKERRQVERGLKVLGKAAAGVSVED